ncbi:MAG: hypothetical protein WC637_13430 [Victivallales bacterium]
MDFKLLSPIENIETIASGHGIRNLNRLIKIYGHANWRKIKGTAMVQLDDGAIFEVEIHWYEGHGIGKKELKIKRYLS